MLVGRGSVLVGRECAGREGECAGGEGECADRETVSAIFKFSQSIKYCIPEMLCYKRDTQHST